MPRYLIDVTAAQRDALLDALAFTLAAAWDPSAHTVRQTTMDRALHQVAAARPLTRQTIAGREMVS